jgi:teichoic acid transport system permease protein
MSSMPARVPNVYEATASGLPPLRQYLAELKERRPFIWHLARTDLKAKNYNTGIGQFWIILDPLLAAAVYYLMRTIIRPVGSGAARNLVLSHLIWAVFFFQFVQASMNYGARSLMNGRGMVLNSAFPRAVLPLYASLRALLDFLPTLAVYAVFQYVLQQPFGMSLIMLPVVIVILAVLTMGLAFLLAATTVFFRDMTNFLPYITRLLMYVSPVLFATYEIPKNLRVYLQWNPLYPIYAALEQIFRAQFPSSTYLMQASAWAVLFWLWGVIYFLAKEREFAVRL